jgi:hypothetical protein
MEYLEQREFSDRAAFIKAFNAHRLANKNKWLAFAGTVAGKRVEVKGWGTTIQILNVDGIRHHGGSDMKVAEWKEMLDEAIA